MKYQWPDAARVKLEISPEIHASGKLRSSRRATSARLPIDHGQEKKFSGYRPGLAWCFRPTASRCFIEDHEERREALGVDEVPALLDLLRLVAGADLRLHLRELVVHLAALGDRLELTVDVVAGGAGT